MADSELPHPSGGRTASVTGSSATHLAWSYIKAEPWLRRRRDVALNYLYSFTPRPKRHGIRLLIFAQGRTGSTLLEHLLGSTGHFQQYGEVFNRKSRRDQLWDPIRYVRGLARRKADENIVVHVKIYQLTKDRKRPTDPARFLNELHNDGWSIIHLRRRNKVSQVLSNLIANQRGSYHKYADGDHEDEKFRLLLDIDDFVSRVRQRFSYDEAERKALADIPYLEVIYEDDLEKTEDHQSTVDRILRSLSLEPRDASTKLRKINNQSFKDLIVNYDEFVECVASENWQDFL